MKILIFALFLALTTTAFPDGKVGVPYSHKVAEGLTKCRAEGGTIAPLPGVINSVPSGTGLRSDGTLIGTPTKAFDFRFVAACVETRTIVTVTITE